ncbi:mitochondrial thiamine pyrophosphate carrier 1 [Purpureocillium lavendulum]|uniref:Mitochondrial thiamine pyrophosphate carrier 1 n=1 Tax=Purpureocillium lavendulum TaxID=1247861 RepID=A0AB34G405_9HYPO|nr:mitochondrial thiamine pyrophosphate carrier 1 [Purpureocillium lavendulum]
MSFVIAPLDVVKIRLQLQPYSLSDPLLPLRDAPAYRGTFATLKHILHHEGFTALWKGNVPAELMYVCYTAVQFTTYRSATLFLQTALPTRLPDAAESFIAGAASGAAATTVTYPLDLLRTRFAAQGRHRIYGSLRAAMWDIHRDEGVRGFYRGLAPAVGQIIPFMGIFFVTYEGLRARLAGLNMPWGSGDATAGITGSVIAKTAVFPLDLVRKRIQVQGPTRRQYVYNDIPEYTSALRAIRSIAQTEGIRGLYKGLPISLIKTAPNLATSMLRGMRTPSDPGGSGVAVVRPVCLRPSLASSKVPSVTTRTSKRSACRGGALLASSHSEKAISSSVPVRTAATAMGSCSGGPAVMPNTSLHEGRLARGAEVRGRGGRRLVPVEQQAAHVVGGEDLVAQVEGHDGGLAGDGGVVEDVGGGLGVDEDVKLGPGGDVADALGVVDDAHGRVGEAAAEGAAHEAEAADVGDEVRVRAEEGADVCEGAGGDEPGGAGGLRAQGRGHGVDGGDGRGRAARRREQLGAVEARVAVDVGRRVQGRPLEGLAEADMERHVVVLAEGREDRGGITVEMPSSLIRGWYAARRMAKTSWMETGSADGGAWD